MATSSCCAGGAAALARAIGGRTLPLAVVRQDEIVVVVPAADGLAATIAPRIAERTGYDLRRVSDLIEILIAARLADAELVASHNRGGPN